jgi:hypothetical protein
VAEFSLDKLSLTETSALIQTLATDVDIQKGVTLKPLGEEIFRLSEQGDPLLISLYADEVREAVLKGAETVQEIAKRLSERSSGLGPYFEYWIGEQKQSFAASTVPGSMSFILIEVALLILANAFGPIRYEDLSELLHSSRS